jgi:AcrR family transcriptional regulator
MACCKYDIPSLEYQTLDLEIDIGQLAYEADVMTELPVAAAHRRARRQTSPEEVRTAMLETARELVEATGVTVSLEELSLERVIQIAGVPRSAVYRIWPYKGDFVDDLLCHMAKPDWLGASAFDQLTVDRASQFVMSHADKLDNPEGRRLVLQEAVRQAVKMNFEALVASKRWHAYIALLATAQSTHDEHARARIVAALRESAVSFTTKMTAFYTAMAQLLGLRMRHPAYRLEHLVAAGAALLDGLALQQALTQDTDGKLVSAGPDGTDWPLGGFISEPVPGPGFDGPAADWSVAAIAFMGLVDAFLEADWIEPEG